MPKSWVGVHASQERQSGVRGSESFALGVIDFSVALRVCTENGGI